MLFLAALAFATAVDAVVDMMAIRQSAAPGFDAKRRLCGRNYTPSLP